MNRKWLTCAVMAMFVLSLFAGIAAAQPQREQYEKAKEKYQVQKARVDAAKQNFNDAREKFRSAKLKFKSAKDKLSRDDLKNKSVEYLERTIDYMIAHLENQKLRIQNAENRELLPFDAGSNIDSYIAQLEDIRIRVQQANSSEELASSARGIEETALKIRLETRYYAGILINHRIDLFLAKADNVSERLDAQIQKLNEQGKDTSKLEDKAAEFNDRISEAGEIHARTLELYKTHAGFDSNGMVTNIQDARGFLEAAGDLQKDTLKKLKEAANKIRIIFSEFKKISSGRNAVQGTGRLEANGSGRAVIEGDLTATLSGDATLIVSGNADVTTSSPGTKEVLGNGNVKYHGFGTATVTGENIRVEISGNNIALEAEGTGSAVLSGNGTYSVERAFAASGEWDREE